MQFLWKKPSPAPNSRSLLKGAGGVTALPPFHFFASSPAHLPSSSTTSPSHDSDLPTPNAWTHPPPTSSSYAFSPISSPRSGFTSPSLSPGPNIRRLAEQFLNSLPDDSPASGNRSLSRQPSSRAAQQRLHPQVQQQEEDSTVDAAKEDENATDEAVVDMRVTEEAIDDTSAWTQLHEECLTFARLCTTDASSQRKLREDLVARTRWSIRAVWPQAEVDLVGSVAAGVALPKSDLDFVIWFEKGKEAPKSYSYTTAPAPPAPPELPFVVCGEAEGQGAGVKEGEGPSRSPVTGYSSIATASPLSTTSTLSLTSNSSTSSHSSASSTLTSPTSSTSSLSSAPTLQYFAHAGALIKLIGGRKKSKLLFRSTKIQVFKDINLIRLRDGCSGISMDLWFPADPAILTRSQQHTTLLRQYAEEWKWFTPLAFVIKTFMQQHLLNSGYSGLGSYGVLLMIVRFLQEDRARREGAGEEEANVGRVLCHFLRFWVEFDYINFAIDVRGQGQFTDKPVLNEEAKPVSRDEEEDEVPAEEEDVVDDEPQEGDGRGDERSRRRRKAVVTGDRLSLVIADPCDSSNYVVCHHKALRNMLYAFIHACTVLDPLTHPPHPAKDVQTVAAFTDAELHSAPTSVASSNASSNFVSAAASTASTAPPTPTMSPPSSTPPSSSATPSSTTQTSPASSPTLPSSSPPPLPQFSSKSRFHRLIDIYHARLGPSMKLCPSLTCLNSDGSSTLCPVQNKVCYTCGHVFLKHGAAGGSAPNAGTGAKPPRDREMGGRDDVRAGKARGRPHRGRGQSLGSGYRGAGRGVGTPAQPLNQVGAGGMIANTNGMKFVSPPPSSPTVPSITPAAAARGFVYVQPPGGVPPAFNASMAVSSYYPGGGGGGGGYYGGGSAAYDRGYVGGGGYGGYQGGGKRGGRSSRGGGGYGAMGMGGAAYGGVMPQFHAESATPYMTSPPYGGYYAGSAMGSGGRY